MDFGVEMDGSQDFFQMFWPVVVSHKIDEKSPLYTMCARDIAEHTFEIILTMEGITPETGNTVQVGNMPSKKNIQQYQTFDTCDIRCEHLIYRMRYSGATGLITTVLLMTRHWPNMWCPCPI